MPNQRLNYYVQDDFSRGVVSDYSQAPRHSKTGQHLSLQDARNVWLNSSGYLEQRPGAQCAGSLTYISDTGTTYGGGTNTFEMFVRTEAAWAETTSVAGLVGSSATWQGDEWFLIIPSANLSSPAATYDRLMVATSSANAVLATAQVSYWDGSAFKPLPIIEGTRYNSKHLAGAQNVFSFEWPGDITATAIETVAAWLQAKVPSTAAPAITSSTGFCIRFKVIYSEAALTAGTAVDLTTTVLQGYDAAKVCGVHTALFEKTQRAAFLFSDPTNDYLIAGIAQSFPHHLKQNSADAGGTADTLTNAEPLEVASSIAVVPQFDEAYLASNRQVWRCWPREPINLANCPEFAEVEDSEAFIGESDGVKAPYHPTYVPQQESWPKANHMVFHDGRLWALDLAESPFMVRWSCAAPAHRVWPDESFAVLSEADNSRITGAVGQDEYLLVFKERSIWRLIFGGSSNSDISGQGSLAQYQAVRLPGTVGCLAPATLAASKKGVFFLGPDGVYVTDGARTEYISDPVRAHFERLTRAARARAVGVNWASEGCYLIAISTNAAEYNDLVLVFDYEEGRWWIWDGWEVRCWYLDDTVPQNPALYYVDNNAMAFKVGGRSDHGTAIDSWVLTHRFGEVADRRKVLREVQVLGDTRSNTFTIDVYPDDESTAVSGSIIMTDSNDVTLSAFTLDSDTLRDRPQRRRAIRVREDADWWQVRVRTNTAGYGFHLRQIQTGFVARGKR